MARKFGFALIDAFTRKPLGGNPCAVVLDGDRLTPEEMQAIAREMNQSETAFLLRTPNADLGARYFTPEREIPLAGHPTIALMHAAIEAGLVLPRAPKTEIKLELKDGPIRVELEPGEAGVLIRMFQRKPIFGEFHDPAEVLPLFGLAPEDLMEGAKIQSVSTGTVQLMIPLRDHAALKKLEMESRIYRKYRAKKGFFSPHFFCLGGVTPGIGLSTFARHLGTPPDTSEDAFTGSGTGGMAAYLWKHGFLKEPRFTAEQGHWMGRPGTAQVEVFGPREDIEAVSVAGYAASVIRGEMTL
jgi:trans-2,3-dihydro-3-hydroxyanthranilate isomerase